MFLKRSGILIFSIYCAIFVAASTPNPTTGHEDLDAVHDDNPCLKFGCVPKVSCPSLMRPDASAITCILDSGRLGVCCTTGQNHTTKEDLKFRSAVSINEKSLKEAKNSSDAKLKEEIEKQKKILSNPKSDGIASRGNPTFGHFQSQRTVGAVESSEKIGLAAFTNLFATEALKARESISDDQLIVGLGHVQLEKPPCPPQPKCKPGHKYRNIDGTCNNDEHPTWGATRTATERLLPPNYSDGIWAPRTSAIDKRMHLASPRHVSRVVFPDVHRPHDFLNLMAMQFGQFIAHDVSSSVTLTYPNGTGVSCCAQDGSSTLPPDARHFGCMPIDLEGDLFYSKFNQKCMSFVRTQLAPSHDCSLGYARQMNGVTHFLDLSQVYGSDAETLDSLREKSGGRMRMFQDFGRELLPLSDDPNDCLTMELGSACFKSGDGHANQLISLVAVHMVFTREHNRVAHILSLLNPHWDDELLFLEARRITIAEFQHIIYNEYLPIIIGQRAMDEFKLRSRPPHEYSFDYNHKANPSLVNEFSVAAFRFGHSTVDGHLLIPNKHDVTEEMIPIPEVMFHPARMRIKEFYDRLLNGMTSQPMQKSDPSISKMLTHYLFRGGNPFGLDLASLNIQRGRDHGLRAYNDYRQLVGLKRFESLHEFGSKPGTVLMHAYANVDDVDLWVGGLLEPLEHGALVGFTFKEIIAEQFARFRQGDKYFYEHSPATNPGAFKPEQLAEIKKVTMSRLICDNSDHIELHVQSFNAFFRRDLQGNEPMDCSKADIPFVDLTPWKETHH